MSRTFWSSAVPKHTAADVKMKYAMERAADKRTKWQVRKNLTTDGVVSNLFPMTFEKASYHRYELEVEKLDKQSRTPVPPNRIWRMFAQALRQHANIPPIVRVSGSVFTTTPLPPETLELPKAFHDLGWEKCALRYAGVHDMTTLPSQEVKSIANKMLPWALTYHAKTKANPCFAVVRDSDGKMICTENGIAVSGLRVYKGTIASVVQVEKDSATGGPAIDDFPAASVLSSLQDGTTVETLTVKCVSFQREVVAKGQVVSMYLVRDASGSMAVTLWGFGKETMTPGMNYEILRAKVKASDPKYPKGDFRVEMVLSNVGAVIPLQAPHSGPVAEDKLSLAVKLDSRCTVASEKSIWDEVKQHFGEPPYDEEKQRRLARAIQGTPVVFSTSLRHTTIRGVRFDIPSVKEAPLDASLRKFEAFIDNGQPFAVVSDYGVVPLQFLHCCFDPKMRSWQDVTVPACSFMPNKRVELLDQFRTALCEGLKPWGIHLAKDGMATKQVVLLTEGSNQLSTSDTVSERPKTHILFSICNSRSSQDDREKCVKTCQTLTKVHRSQYSGDFTLETDALRKLDEITRVVDPRETSLTVVLPERLTRAAYWLMSECLRRGVMPTLVKGVPGEKRQRLLTESVKQQIFQRFSCDPLRGAGITSAIPQLQGKRILVIGVDACHSRSVSTGAIVGQLLCNNSSKSYSTFWRNEVRGKELEQVTQNFASIVQGCVQQSGSIDEVVVFQDGNVYSELESMKACLPSTAGLSFLCLHKRTNIRFIHQSKTAATNVIKGALVKDLTPTIGGTNVPSFFLQNHDCVMSTARTVQYTVHHESSTLPLADIQKLSFCMAHIASPLATKLPFPTRCAHRLSEIAERLADANPNFRANNIPLPLSQRLWFM